MESFLNLQQWGHSPDDMFNVSLTLLVTAGVIQRFIKIAPEEEFISEMLMKEKKPEAFKSLQIKYLPVFWLMRMAFWMSGAYFFPVYSSKVINGEPASPELIRQIFHAGFIAGAVCLPFIGSVVDNYGRKKGTIVAAIFYALGALSMQSSQLWVLVLGRCLGNIGTALMSSIPEAWLASEAKASKVDPFGRWLSNTFTIAYSFDSIVAISAGKLSSVLAGFRGAKGPFEVSPLFLTVAVMITLFVWKENSAKTTTTTDNKPDSESKKDASISDAVNLIWSDKKILMVGAAQSLFEAAMYIFVMQWPVVMNKAVVDYFGAYASTPFGTVFMCFMACCLLGSNLFGQLVEMTFRVERIATCFMIVSAICFAGMTCIISFDLGLIGTTTAFFAYEFCVGLYFPSIGALRSKYLPDSHRSAMMTLFAVPFNIIVLSISLSIKAVGTTGALAVASILLVMAALCMIKLQMIAKQEAIENLPSIWRRCKAKWIGIARVIQIRKLCSSIAKEVEVEERRI